MIDINKTFIYHITSIDNLSNILQCDALWCDEQRIVQDLTSVNIAHKHIKERRRKKQIPLPTNNESLSDYVPFYFCNRSPMLYAIHKNQVNKYSGTQQDIIYLVASVGRIISNCKWCFTDGHAILEMTQFYNSVDDLDKIDWELINTKYWASTSDDLDRSRRKQAEFLIYNSFLWNWVEKIGVISQDYADKTQQLLQDCEHKPIVEIKPEWYY